MADAFDTGQLVVRELKVTGRPKQHFYLHQLLWNCWCAAVPNGELDLIYRPNFERPDWAFERLQFEFSERDFARLLIDVEAFLESRRMPSDLQPRNSRACDYCPHIKRCWDDGR